MPTNPWTNYNTLSDEECIFLYALGAKGFLPDFSIWPIILGSRAFFVLLVGLLKTRVKVPYSRYLNKRFITFK